METKFSVWVSKRQLKHGKLSERKPIMENLAKENQS